MATRTRGSAAVSETADTVTDRRATDDVPSPATMDTVRESIRRAIEALPTTEIQRCRPDGDWLRDEATIGRSVWTRTTEFGHEERVVLSSPGFSRGWEVLHQPPSGRSMTLTDGVTTREKAKEIAEREMADLAGVPKTNRSAETTA